MKKFTILALTLWSITNVFAFESLLEPQIRMGERSRIDECTQNWLQNSSDESSSSGGLRGLPEIGGETPPNDPVFPVGSGLPILLALGSAYVLRRRKNK